MRSVAEWFRFEPDLGYEEKYEKIVNVLKKYNIKIDEEMEKAIRRAAKRLTVELWIYDYFPIIVKASEGHTSSSLADWGGDYYTNAECECGRDIPFIYGGWRDCYCTLRPGNWLVRVERGSLPDQYIDFAVIEIVPEYVTELPIKIEGDIPIRLIQKYDRLTVPENIEKILRKEPEPERLPSELVKKIKEQIRQRWTSNELCFNTDMVLENEDKIYVLAKGCFGIYEVTKVGDVLRKISPYENRDEFNEIYIRMLMKRSGCNNINEQAISKIARELKRKYIDPLYDEYFAIVKCRYLVYKGDNDIVWLIDLKTGQESKIFIERVVTNNLVMYDWPAAITEFNDKLVLKLTKSERVYIFDLG